MNEMASVFFLQSEISKALGNGYLVNTNALTSSLSRGTSLEYSMYGEREMDLVIWGPSRKRPVIVEFKSLRKGVGVPLSTVPLLIDLVDKNPGLQPYLIFATNGVVGSLVRHELGRRNIIIVESDSLSAMAMEISNIVISLD